jgi:hypothetical protein
MKQDWPAPPGTCAARTMDDAAQNLSQADDHGALIDEEAARMRRGIPSVGSERRRRETELGRLKEREVEIHRSTNVLNKINASGN